ncbi:hypothetical protein DM01DRAFT_1408875 [Hesseltinella vesiculosa]|uniref:F-box domain-containing protein n=1 Tax=Hesseltinella vesiculosa TaxID=101127 RepID=A0A1X2GCX1_9FUNG|nr:hypothetical protein DM01DRAFT_1408875 [Hesseltinella vesiculosa]
MNALELGNELLTCIAGHLALKDLAEFGTVCRRFHSIIQDDTVWREALANQYGIRYKLPHQSWRDTYLKKEQDPHDNRLCPHLSNVDSAALAPYVKKYQAVLNWLPKNVNCATCGMNEYERGACLYVWEGNVRLRCRDCSYRFHNAEPGRQGILIRINVLQLFCFNCSRLLGETRGDESEAYYVNHLLEILTNGSELGREALRQKQQCMDERIMQRELVDRLYILNQPYFLVERVWLCSWFLRLCDGKIGQGPVNNLPLAISEEDDTLDPSARPKGNFVGGFGIITPELWYYLTDTYGLVGSTYTSDDIQGAEYDDLRQAIIDWRLI